MTGTPDARANGGVASLSREKPEKGVVAPLASAALCETLLPPPLPEWECADRDAWESALPRE